MGSHTRLLTRNCRGFVRLHIAVTSIRSDRYLYHWDLHRSYKRGFSHAAAAPRCGCVPRSATAIATSQKTWKHKHHLPHAGLRTPSRLFLSLLYIHSLFASIQAVIPICCDSLFPSEIFCYSSHYVRNQSGNSRSSGTFISLDCPRICGRETCNRDQEATS